MSSNLDNLWWSVPTECSYEHEYTFFYKDYTKTQPYRHGIKFIKGKIKDFINFAHRRPNIVLCKVEEIRLWDDYCVSYDSISSKIEDYSYDLSLVEEKRKEAKRKTAERNRVFSKTYNNWNNCKSFKKR